MNALTRLDKGYPMPQSIGRCADEYKEIRDIRLAMENEAERVKERETELREHIIDSLAKSPDTGAAGLRYRAQLVMKRTFKANDWDVLRSWIRKNDRFDMLQKKLSEKAVAEFFEAEGRVVPGVEAIDVPSLSVTKIGD